MMQGGDGFVAMEPKGLVMSGKDAAGDAPPPAGPFFSTWGPRDGPILARDAPPAMGVVEAPDAIWPVGIAYPMGQVAHRKGPARTFRLVVAKVDLEGRWICVNRRFIALGEAAEEL
jgi:hypothetical protein